MKPTIEFYSYLSEAFDHFNKELFGNELTQVMFVITRRKKTAGHFRKKGWFNESSEAFHEIAVNPEYFISSSPLEIHQTIVHEMCHEWQDIYGTPSRGGYHNKEWAKKMVEIGLRPITKNGKGTGQNAADEPIPNGPFERACISLFLKGHKLRVIDGAFNSVDRLLQFNSILAERVEAYKDEQIEKTNSDDIVDALDEGEVGTIISSLSMPIVDFYEVDIDMHEGAIIESRERSKKTTYICSGCGARAWGGRSLNISCTPCRIEMVAL